MVWVGFLWLTYMISGDVYGGDERRVVCLYLLMKEVDKLLIMIEFGST